jgi:hypothetical protein
MNKFTWTSPELKMHNKINHILIDRRRHSSIIDVRSFKAADCNTDHYLVVAKIRERLAVSKQKTQRVSAKESLSYHELKRHKPWFD